MRFPKVGDAKIMYYKIKGKGIKHVKKKIDENN